MSACFYFNKRNEAEKYPKSFQTITPRAGSRQPYEGGQSSDGKGVVKLAAVSDVLAVASSLRLLAQAGAALRFLKAVKNGCITAFTFSVGAAGSWSGTQVSCFVKTAVII